jgi:hypothetical protein
VNELPFARRAELVKALECGCIPRRPLGRTSVETTPRPDPHQAMLEAGLREGRGFELVRDPLGRIA